MTNPPALVAPKRFRRRLTGMFIMVAAVASGVLAIASFLIVHAYRTKTFAAQAERQSQIAILTLPDGLSARAVERTLARYQVRGGFDAVVAGPEGTFATAPGLDLSSIPASLRNGLSRNETRSARLGIQGKRYLAVGGLTRDESNHVYFLFARSSLLAGLDDLRNTLALGWLVIVAIAALVGSAVARRTLAPVREAALASRALAQGLLDTRVDRPGRDEFATWAHSFNDMAVALQSKIGELSAAAQRERRFTADVAHDLRTPLTALVSAAALLDEYRGEMSDRAQHVAHRLSTDIRRLQALVLDLLELTRLDAGHEHLHVEPLWLAASLRAVAAPWHEAGSVTVDVDPELCVLADRVRFRRVVANLITNAFDHGGGSPSVTARRIGDVVAIDVVDHGPGIKVEQLDLIFDRFFKADVSRSSGAAGLGLAIANESARVMGGSLVASNVPSGGACFTLTLPACRPPSDRAAGASLDHDSGVDAAGP